MPTRLGLDMGTNSIGWCLLDMDGDGRPTGIRDLGVRVFPDGRDPQSGTSLAVDRRTARGARRRRDRFLLRRKDLMDALVRHGLMPEDERERKTLETLDPYDLRARGLDEALPLHHLGRALFHLHQRRGFKSNRRTERRKDDDPGKIKAAGDRLAESMAADGARTLGEFLARGHVGLDSNDPRRRPVRARLNGRGAKAEYEFYPQREMVEAEFDALWTAQRAHRPDVLTDVARDEIRGIMFRQRPLRPVDPGKCALDPAADKDDSGGFRAPWALPLAQRFRILQELANMRYSRLDTAARRLDRSQRDALAKLLFQGKNLTFDKARRTLGLDGDVRFNLESERRKGLDGDRTAKVLSDKKRFGDDWHALAAERQAEIVERLLDEEDEDTLVAWLEEDCGLSPQAARAVADAPLPDGHARLGRRALGKVVPVLENESVEAVDETTGEVFDAVITYDKAVGLADPRYHHSDRRPEERLERLPYYGEGLPDRVSGTGDPEDPPEERYGRIPNPTVHIGLNQLRRLVNDLIDAHGAPPDEVVVELARELKQSREQRERIDREQTENQKKNDARRAKLAEMGQPDTGENRMRLRLYEELDAIDRRCVYTGEQIGIEMLFSDAVNIDHILPFSRTLDNSAANRVLCLRRANRLKTNKTPFEAFGRDPEWPEIVARAESLPGNKRWRFAPDAMERYERDRDFLDRQLTDTAYLARTVKAYLGLVADPDRIWVTPGRLTAMLRGKWGLDSLLWDHNLKNRADHRHHAIDAFVTAVTTRSLLQRVSRAAAQAEDRQLDRLIDDLPVPFDGFRDVLGRRLEETAVSHRPDHGVAGQLHEDTAYGLVRDPARWDGNNLVFRKPVTALSPGEVKRIRDPALRARVEDYLHEAEAAGAKREEALARFAEDTGIRRVRILKPEKDVIALRDPEGKPYKAVVPGTNHRIDIYEQPDGSWVPEVVTVFDANRGVTPARRNAHPAARIVMRVFKGDLIKLEANGEEEIKRVYRLNVAANRLWLAGARESGNLQARHDDPDDPFRWDFATISKLKERRARKVHVDPLGRVHDPGPPR